ncbi:tryptophan tryptophylquinone biosynthesis enzyme MauG [Pseudoalteromonas sp. NBT06-2]|uniref:cytochrome-c peroxidase n=1 Tax=Pseudoalteromonas sp. NBT06-2 TaxID=2025950 RepID=UPI000BA5E92F|nr:cytochrome c peroxidase [Pseudoalteromonas sp. NBT06-2]PAJ75541.1 tryptophan tryptophylquinone biosynthesis enzyme MauG [Pseudoalteromonas sp. NBT06-2]
MKIKKYYTLFFTLGAMSLSLQALEFKDITFEAGHESLKEWILPTEVPYPEGNKPTSSRVALGKMLFFDPRISGDGNMSCSSCHNALLGWSDALATTKGSKSKVLGRASPSIINTAFNPLQMWDGRKKSLEDQAIGPMESEAEMNTDFDKMMLLLNQLQDYVDAFESAYPGEGINKKTIAKAIASYERTVISNTSPFDAWIKGDEKALSSEQIEGFKLFSDPKKGNCEVCHSAPNFTDNGFHNIGLASFGIDKPDMGRYAQKPLKLMKGAFKTPTLRDINRSSPYFHDGSAGTLEDVIEHYVLGGENKTNLSPNMKKSNLNDLEKKHIAAFLNVLSSPIKPITLPILPQK